MSENIFHFRETLMVPVSSAIVFEYLTNAATYTQWWGSVIRKSSRIGDVKTSVPGSRCKMEVRGLLPILLHLEHSIVSIDPGREVVFDTTGDLRGTGKWQVEQVDNSCRIVFEWSIRPERKLIKLFSPVFRPLFRMHHKYCMRKAQEGLRREIVRKLNRLPLSSIPMF